MEDDRFSDTRVFVSGLPPNFTGDQLGAHFAMRYPITDTVVVPGRRIGFVGFRNYTLARDAVKYFDKSYIRMSKISVEIAKPIEVGRDGGRQAAPVSQKAHKKPSQPRKDLATASSEHAPENSPYPKGSLLQPHVPLTSDPKKRKRDRDGLEKQESFRNSMDTMHASGSSPTWSSGTNATSATRAPRTRSPPAVATANTAHGTPRQLAKIDKKTGKGQNFESGLVVQGDSTSAQRKKRRKKPELAEEMGIAGQSPLNATAVKGADVGLAVKETTETEKKKHKTESATNDSREPQTRTEWSTSSTKAKYGEEKASSFVEDGVDHSQLENVKNDDDWLRERTNRALDLVGNDGMPVPQSPSATSEDGGGSSRRSEYHAVRQVQASPLAQRTKHSLENGRLFIRNLPYTASEVEIQDLFAKYGRVTEVHMVQDAWSSSNKGLAYVQYGDSNSAVRALRELDGASFQGRLLHILPALDKKLRKLDDYEISKLPLKKQKEIKRKREAGNTAFSWNSLYMNPDAVLSSVADRLGVPKAELLDPTSSNAAVKQAHAETHVIQETKMYLEANRINIDAFQQPSRDDRTLLVKNFPFGVTIQDLQQLFEPHGRISQMLLPPTGTMAIVQYSDAREAASALKQLGYKNIKGSVLFLERAPRGLFDESALHHGGETDPSRGCMLGPPKPNEEPTGLVGSATSTLFVRNLNFATTAARLKEVFEPLAGFLSARVKTKIDPKRPGEILSMGFGFVDFRTPSQAQAALSVMNGHELDNHRLVVEASHKTEDVAEERRRDDLGKKLEAKKTKVVIKNLPFEASKKDVRALFSAYGQLRSIRLPKKFDQSTRGFAFADFVSAKEAGNAIAALTNTHLLGRRLVLEFATGDAIDPEDEIRTMEQRVSLQTNIVNLSKMTGSGRKKFDIDARDAENL